MRASLESINRLAGGELVILRDVGIDITSLTASWKDVFGADLAFIHDAPPSSGRAVLLAASFLAASRKHDRLLQWSRQAFDVAFIHCATKVCSVSVTDNAMHLYEPEAELDPNLGWQVFDSLSQEQRANYAKLCPRTVDARTDFGESFSLKSISTHALERQPQIEESRVDVKATHVWRWPWVVDTQLARRYNLPSSDVIGTGGFAYMLCASGRPIPFPIEEQVAWDDDQNQRRCDLIDKEIDGTITDEEQIELLSLHARLRQHLDKVAPVPLEGARKLHAQLLEKKRQQERQD